MVSRREKLARTMFKLREQTFLKQAQVLRLAKVSPGSPHSSPTRDKSKEIDEAALEAILQANHGPSIYDEAFSHECARMCRPEDYESLVARISGAALPSPAPATSSNSAGLRDLNGLARGVGGAAFFLDNPYRRSYLNGAERRRLGLSSRSASSESSSAEGSSTSSSSSDTEGRASSADSSASSGEEDNDKRKKGGSEKDKKRVNGVQPQNKERRRGTGIYTDSEDETDRSTALRDAVNRESGGELEASGSKLRKSVVSKPAVKVPEKISAKENLEPRSSKTKASAGSSEKRKSVPVHSSTEMEISSVDDDVEMKTESRAKKVKKKARVGARKKGNDTSAGEDTDEEEEEKKPNRFLGKGRPRKTSKDVTDTSTSSHKHAASEAGSLNKERETSRAATGGDGQTGQTGGGILAYVPQRRAARKAAEHITEFSKSKDMIEEMLLREVAGEDVDVKSKSSGGAVAATAGGGGGGSKRGRPQGTGKKKEKKSIFSASDDSDIEPPALLRAPTGTER
jgi:hypothetical protein